MISFGELLLIALVGLLVIGPRRLPETVRFVALQAGRLRQALTETRKMVEDELGMDDIRRQLHNEQVMRSLNATREQIERAAQGLPPATNTEKQSDLAGQSEAVSDADAQTNASESQPDSSSAPSTPAAPNTSMTAPAVADQSDSADDAASPHDAESHDANSPDIKTP